MGDAGTWHLDHRARVDNPVIGANRKAHMLQSLVAAQPSRRGRPLPRVDGIVFLSQPTLDVQLMPEGRANVYGPDGQRALPSISEYLIKPGLVDASLGRAIERAIGEAGIDESQRALATLRLYISAPSDLDLRPLLDGLKRRGAEPYVLSDVAPLGTEILHSLRSAIQGADRVLVVLGEDPAPNPMFEAGLALGLGKPLLIIAAPGATVPVDLAGQVIARARPDDLDAINFALDQVRERVTRETRHTPGPGGRPLGAAVVDQLLARLRTSGHTEASAGDRRSKPGPVRRRPAAWATSTSMIAEPGMRTRISWPRWRQTPRGAPGPGSTYPAEQLRRPCTPANLDAQASREATAGTCPRRTRPSGPCRGTSSETSPARNRRV
jgi:hypothetical protein